MTAWAYAATFAPADEAFTSRILDDDSAAAVARAVLWAVVPPQGRQRGGQTLARAQSPGGSDRAVAGGEEEATLSRTLSRVLRVAVTSGQQSEVAATAAAAAAAAAAPAAAPAAATAAAASFEDASEQLPSSSVIHVMNGLTYALIHPQASTASVCVCVCGGGGGND
jgi:sugar (pentulose or hexulose) kinase